MLRRTESTPAANQTNPAPAAAPAAAPATAAVWPEVELKISAKVERRQGERRGMDALRAEALQTVMSRVEDRNFNGIKNKVSWGRGWSRGIKPQRIVLLVVALLAGGVAAYLATQRQPVAEPAPEITQAAPAPAAARVLVAKQAIGVGERLTADSVEWQDWPETGVRADYISIAAEPEAITDMAGTMARFEFFPGEPIQLEKLVKADQGYLSAVLDTGKRGVSVSVSADSASGGFIVPNDHVDVVLTRPGLIGQISETILHNVPVLAINTRLGETGTTGEQQNPDDPRTEIFSNQAIATLALDPAQAEIIINAGSVGKLSLVLRSMVDFNEPEKLDPAQSIRMTSPFWAK